MQFKRLTAVSNGHSDSYAIKTGPQQYIDKRVCRQSVGESVGHFTSAYCWNSTSDAKLTGKG